MASIHWHYCFDRYWQCSSVGHKIKKTFCYNRCRFTDLLAFSDGHHRSSTAGYDEQSFVLWFNNYIWDLTDCIHAFSGCWGFRSGTSLLSSGGCTRTYMLQFSVLVIYRKDVRRLLDNMQKFVNLSNTSTTVKLTISACIM